MPSLRLGLCHDDGLLTRDPSALRRLDIVVFPELMDGGYAALYAGKTPHRPDDEWVGTLRLSSRRASSLIVAGSTCYRSASGRSTNTSLVFRRGRIVHRYDKIHLFKPCRDHRYFTPGTSVGTFLFTRPPIRVRMGVIICYDLRFPELIRMQASAGMQLLIVPARWPSARDDAWSTLLKARAIENQIFVVGCNAQGNEGGASYVFGPEGEMLFTNKGSKRPAAVETVTLDLRRLAAARRLHQNIRDAKYLPGRSDRRGGRT
jgi:omega-amidase